MNRGVRWLLLLLGTTTMSFGIGACIPSIPKTSGPAEEEELEFTYVDGDEDSENYLLEIRINGPILNSPSSSGFFAIEAGVTYA